MGIVLKKGIVRETEKGIPGEDVPAADRGNEDDGDGHSLPKADRGKGMDGDDHVPGFTLVKAFSSSQKRLAHHTPLATSPKVISAACTEQAIPF